MNQVSQCPQTHGKKCFHWQYVPHVARWAHAGSHMYVVQYVTHVARWAHAGSHMNVVHISQVRKKG